MEHTQRRIAQEAVNSATEDETPRAQIHAPTAVPLSLRRSIYKPVIGVATRSSQVLLTLTCLGFPDLGTVCHSMSACATR